MKRILVFPALALAAALMAGCAPNVSPTTATVGLQAEHVALGRILALRPVNIQPSNAGGAAGAAVGGLAGSQIGSNNIEHALGALAGLIGGGILGHHMGEAATQTQGVEVSVRLDSGRLLAVAQAIAKPPLRVHERVQVIYGTGTVRVLPLH